MKTTDSSSLAGIGTLTAKSFTLVVNPSRSSITTRDKL